MNKISNVLIFIPSAVNPWKLFASLFLPGLMWLLTGWEWSVMHGFTSLSWHHSSSLFCPPHYDRSVTQVTSGDTFSMTFLAFIHWPESLLWPFPDYLKYCPIFAASHVSSSVLHSPRTRQHHNPEHSSKYFNQESKKYILFRQVPVKITKPDPLKVLLQQNSRIFWYEVSQRLALLHEILTRNINFGQF